MPTLYIWRFQLLTLTNTFLLKYTVAYIKYFLYLALNWNFPLAFYIIKKEIEGEKKYGLRTTGIDDLTKSMNIEEREHASIYQPVNFYTAEALFSQVDALDLQGGFLDMGCGKGRVLAMAAAFGFTEIIGVDFSAQLCYEANNNTKLLAEKYQTATITIECEDARDYNIPNTISVIFLFNPFDDLVMDDFLKQVKKSLLERPRRLKILYANPQCKKQWLKAGFNEVHFFKKMKFLEGSVLVNTI
jgi:SAM-dependent methyltransferase